MLFVAGHYRKGDTGLISSRIGLETEAEMFRDGDDLFARVAEHHEHTRCIASSSTRRSSSRRSRSGSSPASPTG